MFERQEWDSGIRYHYVPCECSSLDHMFCFVYFENKNGQMDFEDGFDEIYLEVQMINHRSFWKRAWAALKYTFGYKCKYGHWDSASISRSEARKIVELLNKFIDAPVKDKKG